MKKKILAGVLACVLLIGIGVGGTLAWLSANSADVVNTFTVGNINIKLDEAPLKSDGTLDTAATRVTSIDTYKMVPGTVLPKDPKATVLANSEECWLFVKIIESTDAKFSDFMSYEIADGWTSLGDGVYYQTQTVKLSDKDQGFGILKNDQVKVKDTVTKEMMDAVDAAKLPKLTFKAFAHQAANVDFATASAAAVAYFNK